MQNTYPVFRPLIWVTFELGPPNYDTDVDKPTNLPTNLRDFLSFYTVFQFRFGIFKVAKSNINLQPMYKFIQFIYHMLYYIDHIIWFKL